MDEDYPTLRVENGLVIDDVLECFTCGAQPGEPCREDCSEAISLMADKWATA